MGLTVKVDTSGLVALLQRLKKAKPLVTLAMAENIAERADKDCPVISGKLKNSQRIVKKSDGSTSVTYGNSQVRYAAVVHNSPTHSRKKGWLRRAAVRSGKVAPTAAQAMAGVFKG